MHFHWRFGFWMFSFCDVSKYSLLCVNLSYFCEAFGSFMSVSLFYVYFVHMLAIGFVQHVTLHYTAFSFAYFFRLLCLGFWFQLASVVMVVIVRFETAINVALKFKTAAPYRTLIANPTILCENVYYNNVLGFVLCHFKQNCQKWKVVGSILASTAVTGAVLMIYLLIIESNMNRFEFFFVQSPYQLFCWAMHPLNKRICWLSWNSWCILPFILLRQFLCLLLNFVVYIVVEK